MTILGTYKIEKMIVVMIAITAAKAVCLPYFALKIRIKRVIRPR
jgi:hypothetical protein